MENSSCLLIDCSNGVLNVKLPSVLDRKKAAEALNEIKGHLDSKVKKIFWCWKVTIYISWWLRCYFGTQKEI